MSLILLLVNGICVTWYIHNLTSGFSKLKEKMSEMFRYAPSVDKYVAWVAIYDFDQSLALMFFLCTKSGLSCILAVSPALITN